MQKRFFILLMFVTSMAAHAQVAFGTPDCGRWIKQPTEPRKAWLLGYMSGLSAMHKMTNGKPNDPLDKVSSAEQIFLWMDNYCKENPLQVLTVGGAELFVELMKK